MSTVIPFYGTIEIVDLDEFAEVTVVSGERLKNVLTKCAGATDANRETVRAIIEKAAGKPCVIFVNRRDGFAVYDGTEWNENYFLDNGKF